MDILIFIFEITGIATYAVLGAMTAIKKRMDLFGTVILGVVTAVGGGIIRDIILGRTPPIAFVKPVYAVVAIICSLIIAIPGIRLALVKSKKIYNKAMFILDTVGLSFFTVIGIGIAFESTEYNMFLVVFVGVITGVGGGVLRDILSGEIPHIFVKHIYACASILGAITSAFLWDFSGKFIAMVTGMAVIIVIRTLSAHFKWNLPIILNDEEKRH